MKITTTAKYIVAHYKDFQVWSGNNGTGGPARVYYSKDAFSKAAKHYGWGDVAPTDLVDYGGDKTQVFEILVGILAPERVLR